MRATAATALSLLTACSFMSARGPAGGRKFGEAPQCSSSSGSVAVDGLTGIGGIAIGLSGADGVDVVGGLIGAAYLGSAIYGYSATRRCDKARADYQDELAQLERDEEQADARERRAKASATAPPPPVLRPPPIAPTPPPAVATLPAPEATVPPPAATTGDLDPFAAPVPAAAADAEPDADAAGADRAGPDDEAPAGDDASAEELEQRWREFWRRSP